MAYSVHRERTVLFSGMVAASGIARDRGRPEGQRDSTTIYIFADWRPTLQTFGIVATTNAAYYLTFTYVVEHRKGLTTDGSVFLLANTLSLILVLLAKPFGGWLSDRIGRRRLMIILTVAMIALIYPAFRLMLSGTPSEFVLAQVLLSTPLGMALGLQRAILVEIFRCVHGSRP